MYIKPLWKLIDLGVYDIEGLNDYNNEQNN